MIGTLNLSYLHSFIKLKQTKENLGRGEVRGDRGVGLVDKRIANLNKKKITCIANAVSLLMELFTRR